MTLMKRWLILLVVGHIIGSYAVELVDRVANWDIYAAFGNPPLVNVIAAPAWMLPFLLRVSFSRDQSVERPFALFAWWVAYLGPVMLSFVIALRTSGRSFGRGFSPIIRPDSQTPEPPDKSQ